MKLASAVLLLLPLVMNQFLVNNSLAEVSKELEKLRFHFEVDMAELGQPLQDLNTKYRGHLEKQKGAFRQAGNPDAVLALEEETKSFDTAHPGELSPIPELKQLQEIYREQRTKLNNEMIGKRSPLIRSYSEKAKRLSVQWTKEGKIDDAQLALAESKRFLDREKASTPMPTTKKTSPEVPFSGNLSAAFSTMEEKSDRRTSEPLADWLADTVWKRGTGAALRFEKDGKMSRARPDGAVAPARYVTDEEKQHVLIDWEGGGTTRLELAGDEARLNDRARSATWVRLDQHLAAVATITRRGIPTSERELARRLKGTVWSRNHNAAPPFLYEFTKKGDLFLSIWGEKWRNRKPYQVTGPLQLVIENKFKVEISEDFSTWRGIDGGMTGILIRAD